MEQQTLMDKYIACENKVTQVESALSTRHQELESLQRIVLDLGRQNQTLQVIYSLSLFISHSSPSI